MSAIEIIYPIFLDFIINSLHYLGSTAQATLALDANLILTGGSFNA
jgi:hypothetical protein